MMTREELPLSLSKVRTCSTYGVHAYLVEVETHIERQLPSFAIVGLPDNAVKESRERITAAGRNSGFEFPPRKITVNLAPADIKKEGSAFDLPMAVGILASTGQVSAELLARGTPVNMTFVDNRPKGPVHLHFFDPLNPEARQFVWEKARENYYRYGIKVFWLDEAEPDMWPMDRISCAII